MPKRLRDYFNNLSDVLSSRAKVGGTQSENTDIGINREVIGKEFLDRHVPKRYAVNLGGDIFGYPDKRSDQIDIIINHDMSMSFLENFKIQCPVESVTAAISVKSNLNKAEIFSALNSLASIPQCYSSVIALSPIKPNLSNYLLSWPSLFVFAYDGVVVKTCVEHVANFYSNNPVPFNRVPRAIIVNRKYLISCEQYSVPNANNDTSFDPSFLRVGTVVEDSRGWPLFWLMCEMSKGLSWLDGMYLDYSVYFDIAYRT
jgi:hypothetical protein